MDIINYTKIKKLEAENAALADIVSTNVGDLETLTTTDKSSLVNATNEVKNLVDTKCSANDDEIILTDTFSSKKIFDILYDMSNTERQFGKVISCDSHAIKISVESENQSVLVHHHNRNLLPADWEDDVTYAKRAFGVYTCKTTHATTYLYGASSDPLNTTFPAGQYVFSFSGDVTNPYMTYSENGETKTALPNTPFTADKDFTILYIRCSSKNLTPGYILKWEAQLETGFSVSNYNYPQHRLLDIPITDGIGKINISCFVGKNVFISDTDLQLEYAANPKYRLSNIESILYPQVLSKSDLDFQYGKSIMHRLLKAPSLGTVFNLNDNTTLSTGAFTYIVDVSDIISLSYPTYTTSSNFGSLMVDADGVIVWAYTNKTSAPGTMKNVVVPPNAKYLYLNISPTLSNMDYTFEILSVKQALHQIRNKTISLNERPDTSLCLCAARTEITNNKIPFTSGYLFHKITEDDGTFYLGHNFDNIKEVGKADFKPSEYVIALSPTHNCVIATKIAARGAMYIFDGNTTTELFASAEIKPMGWLYNSGVDFIVDGDGVEHCIFAEYSPSSTTSTGGFNVWRGTAPYTSEECWEIVFFQNYVGDTTVDAITHFHMVRRDPWTDIIYLTSGDGHAYCKWWYSEDYGATWTLLTSGGDSTWEENTLRCINFVFTKDFAYWATDKGTNHSLNKIKRDVGTGVLDVETRVKLADLPEGRATNSICYVDKPNGIFMYDRVDVGYEDYYDTGFDVQYYDLANNELKTLVHINLTASTWGGHRGKCYVNYTSGAEPRPAMGFSVDTPCIMDIPCINPSGIGTVYYDMTGTVKYILKD
jgi:hypothetical protein